MFGTILFEVIDKKDQGFGVQIGTSFKLLEDFLRSKYSGENTKYKKLTPQGKEDMFKKTMNRVDGILTTRKNKKIMR